MLSAFSTDSVNSNLYYNQIDINTIAMRFIYSCCNIFGNAGTILKIAIAACSIGKTDAKKVIVYGFSSP